ncbi:exonuclease SbcCD subunit D C-terminal domain-containing protein [Magnetococcales bacterium HHB-1]
MKILHTSDWHLGRTLFGRKRDEEFELFFHWLLQLIELEQVTTLLVAGDIFDTTTPSNRAQRLYYQFLHRVSDTCCRHVVITAGNHDSPTFLDAPKTLLHALNIHVIGRAAKNPADDILILHNEQNQIELILCAVPYLRDRDIRQSVAEESFSDKEHKLRQGIQNHYFRICKKAEEIRNQQSYPVPIVATGHLFTAGGKTISDDGVRSLYVGTLGQINAQTFPECIDYLALGHLHVAQKVAKSSTQRYSGSPLPMGFGEAKQLKKVLLVEFPTNNCTDSPPEVSEIPVPTIQFLERIQGDWPEIFNRIGQLKSWDVNVWLEIIYQGGEVIGDYRQKLQKAVEKSKIEILRIKNQRIMEHTLHRAHESETLDNLSYTDVFTRCMNAHNIPETQRKILMESYLEVIQNLQERDYNA